MILVNYKVPEHLTTQPFLLHIKDVLYKIKDGEVIVI